MPLVTRHALQLGAPAAPFRLPEPLTGRLIGPDDFPQAKAVLVAFLSNECREVAHIADALADLARDFDARGLQVLAVNSMEAVRGAAEAPAAVAAEALRRGYVFPYLVDQTQAVAAAYAAARAPDFYLFDGERRLTYHGRFDETRFGGARQAHGRDLKRAIESALTGDPAADHQVASQGCSIWRRAQRTAPAAWRGIDARRRAEVEDAVS